MSKFKAGDKFKAKKDFGVVKAGEILVAKDYFTTKDSQWYAGEGFVSLHGYLNDGYGDEYLELVKDKVSPEDEVTITTTYGELAKVYTVMGKVNGHQYGKTLYRISDNIFTDNEIKNKRIFDSVRNLSWEGLKDYNSYQKEWIKALFGEQESEEEKAKALKIKELEESINNAKKQLEELKSLK